MTPIDANPAGLPACLVLHGRGNNAQGMVALGLPPFSDRRRPGRDPTYRDGCGGELPGWLATLGLHGQPSAVLGISMGCFDALVYARGRTGTPLRAAALLNPALDRRRGRVRVPPRAAVVEHGTVAAPGPTARFDRVGHRLLRLTTLTSSTEPSLGGSFLRGTEVLRLQGSVLFYVTTDMVELADAAASSIPEITLAPEDLPCEADFMIFQRPITSVSLG